MGHHLITLMYKAPKLDRTRPTLEARGNWEMDIGDQITDKNWAVASKMVKKVSGNARFKLIHFIFFHRTYLAPIILSKIY